MDVRREILTERMAEEYYIQGYYEKNIRQRPAF